MSTSPETNPLPQELDSGMMIRRAVFLLVLVLLTLYYLAFDFKGLSTPVGMEQAQIARQIARGEKYTTKCIKPAALEQINQHLKEKGELGGVSLMKVPETFHAPLNPLLNSMVLSINQEMWKFDPKGVIYTPDIVIAGVSMLLLLSAIGVNYLLISRIFDARIGGVTAFLMLLCELLWRFSQSGLPHMLMLFLFSFGTYFLYKAVENQQQGKSAYLWTALAGGFFALLAMSHWLTIWIFLGLLIFAAFYFVPRGLQMLVLLGVFALITFLPAYQNIANTGDIMGAGTYAFYATAGNDGLEKVMRDYRMQSGLLNFDGFITKMVTYFVAQFEDLYGYMGSIVAAPLFFLSLLHPFRRREIADFRWCLLAMWFFGTLGMAIFGVERFALERTSSNNLHILFIPLFTAYGLAFVSVLWNRINLPMHNPLFRNMHFILVILISSFPFVVGLPLNISRLSTMPREAKRHYPKYFPRALASLNASLSEKEVIVTDAPWATAWYADRVSVWLPKNRDQFLKLQDYAQRKSEDVAGILFTPISMEQPLWSRLLNDDSDPTKSWATVMLRWPIARKTNVDIMEKDTDFPYREPFMLGDGHIFYSDSAHLTNFVEDFIKSTK